jgi:RNA polymerase sigma-54 factor
MQQKLGLSAKLSHRLILTPSLQQAIKLLPLTTLELAEVLDQEVMENPLLEEVPVQETLSTEEIAQQEAKEEAEKPADDDPLKDIDVDKFFEEYFDDGRRGKRTEVPEAPPIENTLTESTDLYDHLLWQLHMMDVSARERELAELIIGNLNPDGFLVATTEELALLMSADHSDEICSLKEVEEALTLVRDLDPPGIACWDLSQSLLLQLDFEEEPEDSLAREIVAEHWEPFLKRQFQRIAKELGRQLEELEPVIDRIRLLETRPGRKFSTERTQYVEPDVVIVKVSDEYVIQLNDDGMPRLRISRSYRQMLAKMREQRGQNEAKQFIKDKMRAALWLIKSLDQRQRTIYKVANSIVHQQRDFLDHGVDQLRPMVLRDVADDIGMHESTVSRVVSNKYIHTPRGLFPMKFFFHSGIDRDFGGDISSLSVKRKIGELIKVEDPKRPLSDNALTKALNREGINIARRTVAKYRDELQIPSSTDRKQVF